MSISTMFQVPVSGRVYCSCGVVIAAKAMAPLMRSVLVVGNR